MQWQNCKCVLLNNISVYIPKWSTVCILLHVVESPKEGKVYFNYRNDKCVQIPRIEFFGAPFVNVKNSYLQCSQGPKYYRKNEEAGQQVSSLDVPLFETVYCI